MGSQAAAREQVGLERAAVRQEGAEGAELAETAGTALPGLAQALSQRLDCAALAMRYPVGDAFATELMLALYDKLLDKRRPLPAALHLALDDALEADIPKPPLSPATPILVGVRAAELQLAPPPQEAQTFALPTVGLSIAFPPEPARSWAGCNRCSAPARRWPGAARSAACSSTACRVRARPPARWSWPTATSTAASRATSGTAPPRPAATLPAPCST